MIPAVTRDPSADRAAIGQTVTSFATPAATAADITPAVTPPDDGDQTIGNVAIQITKARRVPIRWNGEQTRATSNNGVGTGNIQQQQVNQAIRTLVNEMETDLCGLYVDASRSYGAGGTVPFATAGDYTAATFAQKILLDNGAPQGDQHLVLNTGAGANLRGKQADVDRQGTDVLLRQGVIQDISGMAIRQSGQIATHTKGTGASATTDNAGYAIGATTITLASAGTGTIVAGDSITFAGDSNQYVIVTGDADVSGGGTVVLAAPGLRQAIAASATAITVTATGPRNLCFSRDAIILATRAPALPDDGDMALDRELVTDPVSGMTFEIALYAQYRQMQYEISAAWGVKTLKTQHLALLAG
jgi:hypothetical protein